MVIGSYPNTSRWIDILKKCILQFNEEFDVVLVTHYPAPIEIQQLVKYYIYDVRNEKVKNHDVHYWVDTPDFYAQIYPLSDYGYHAYGVYSSIRNAVSVLKEHYDSFFYCEGDCILHPTDVSKLHLIKQQTKTTNKRCWFIRQSPDALDTRLFYSNIDFYEQTFGKISSIEEWESVHMKIKGSNGGGLENFYHATTQYLNRWDEVMVEPSDKTIQEYFPNSKIDLLNYHGSNYHLIVARVEGTENYGLLFVNSSVHPIVEDLHVKVNGKHVLTVPKQNGSDVYHCVPIDNLQDDIVVVETNDTTKTFERQVLKKSKSFIKFKT